MQLCKGVTSKWARWKMKNNTDSFVQKPLQISEQRNVILVTTNSVDKIKSDKTKPLKTDLTTECLKRFDVSKDAEIAVDRIENRVQQEYLRPAMKNSLG